MYIVKTKLPLSTCLPTNKESLDLGILWKSICN